MLYKRDIKIVAVIIIFTVVLCGGIIIFKKDNEDLIGGNYFLHECLANKEEYVDSKNEFEKYFRPSNLPIINNREDVYKLIDEYYDKNYKDINIDNGFLDTPEDTILNYFSLLREAANPVDDFNLGCGSLGTGKVPYKIGYNFFTQRYKNNNSFKNI